MLVRQYLRDHLYIAAGYLVLLTAALAAAVLYWPDFRDNIPAIAKLVPFQSLQELLEEVEVRGYWPYFCIQQFFKGCSLFGLAAAALFGSGLIARDADQRTAEFLLSRPVSRRRILLTRWATAGVLLTVPVFLSSLAGMWMGAWVDEPLPMAPYLSGSTYLSLFLLMLLTITVWMSAIFDHQLKAGVILIGLVLLQFALYLVKVVGDYSLFALVDVDLLVPMIDGQFPWLQSGIFAGVTVVFLVLAIRQFEQRDF